MPNSIQKRTLAPITDAKRVITEIPALLCAPPAVASNGSGVEPLADGSTLGTNISVYQLSWRVGLSNV